MEIGTKQDAREYLERFLEEKRVIFAVLVSDDGERRYVNGGPGQPLRILALQQLIDKVLDEIYGEKT